MVRRYGLALEPPAPISGTICLRNSGIYWLHRGQSSGTIASGKEIWHTRAMLVPLTVIAVQVTEEVVKVAEVERDADKERGTGPRYRA